jgi:hypothetical protein
MKKKITLSILAMLLLYFLGSFVAMDFNAKNWGSEGRILICFLWILLNIGIAAMIEL